MKDANTVLASAAPVMPVAQFESIDHAKACAELFAEAGVPAIEVTLRHPDAWQMVALFRDAMPEALVGVGTVLNRPQMLRAVDEADFVISPGFSPELSSIARKTLTTYIPGIATATELMAAMADDHRVMKFFPATAIGGVPLLKALAAPFAKFPAMAPISSFFSGIASCLTGGPGKSFPRPPLDTMPFMEITRALVLTNK